MNWMKKNCIKILLLPPTKEVPQTTSTQKVRMLKCIDTRIFHKHFFSSHSQKICKHQHHIVIPDLSKEFETKSFEVVLTASCQPTIHTPPPQKFNHLQSLKRALRQSIEIKEFFSHADTWTYADAPHRTQKKSR